MSVATTVKLPPSLRRRIRPLAKAVGKTPHAWMVDALAEQADREERRQQFVSEALESRRAVAQGEPVYEAGEVFAWLRGRVAGKKAKRPAPMKRGR